MLNTLSCTLLIILARMLALLFACMQTSSLNLGVLNLLNPNTSNKSEAPQVCLLLLPSRSARPLDDGLYRAIDIYLKSHPWLADFDRDHLCRLIDCQKLSLEVCTHAAQNERLPLRTIIQVLFFEQLQLRTSVAGCLLVSDNLDVSRQAPNEGGWTATGVRENHFLKAGMDSMRSRLSELEKECSNMRQEIGSLGRAKKWSIWGNVSKKLGLKSQMCSAQEGSVSKQNDRVEGNEKSRDKLRKEKEKN